MNSWEDEIQYWVDWSTIDVDRLKKLPVWNHPRTYYLSGFGAGCAGDPPGYPTYYLRSVYTQYGNNPHRGAQQVITHKGVHYVVEDSEGEWTQHERKMRRLWVPLPIEHPRSLLWRMDKWRHHQHCYYDPKTDGTGRKHEFSVYPVPGYELKHFNDDVRFSDAWRMQERATINMWNEELQEARRQIATIDNHMAVRYIREYYPDYDPVELGDDRWMDEPPTTIANWWEVMAEQPTPETCRPRWGTHPINGSWCQWCGWKKEDE